MGTTYSLKCNKCGYRVQTSAGHDYGMVAMTDTSICKTCKTIVDVMVGEYGVTYSKEEALSKKGKSGADLKFYICPDCNSGANLEIWDPKEKPCPKCDGKMGKDNYGMVAIWD